MDLIDHDVISKDFAQSQLLDANNQHFEKRARDSIVDVRINGGGRFMSAGAIVQRSLSSVTRCAPKVESKCRCWDVLGR